MKSVSRISAGARLAARQVVVQTPLVSAALLVIFTLLVLAQSLPVLLAQGTMPWGVTQTFLLDSAPLLGNAVIGLGLLALLLASIGAFGLWCLLSRKDAARPLLTLLLSAAQRWLALAAARLLPAAGRVLRLAPTPVSAAPLLHPPRRAFAPTAAGLSGAAPLRE